MERKELICIGCPLGCNLTVEMDGGQVVSVNGNTCKRGDDYARKELTDPRRIVTSTVPVAGGNLPVVSVKTASDIPKEKIRECLCALKGVTLTAPVQIGDVIVENVADTGVDVIATKSISAVETF
jgi:CxxC motif-containing protein